MASFTPSASPILVTVTDRQDRRYSALSVNGMVIIHDHQSGAEVAKLANWDNAAATLSALQY